MNMRHSVTIQQIEASKLSATLYRPAQRLLDLAVPYPGRIELSNRAAHPMYETNTTGLTRVRAIRLKRAGIIVDRANNRWNGCFTLTVLVYPEVVNRSWNSGRQGKI